MSQLAPLASGFPSPGLPIFPDTGCPQRAGPSAPDLRIPLSPNPNTGGDVPTADLARPAILWIDDEPDHALSLLLKDCGCDVEWATTGAAGLGRATAATYDAIVVDVRLDDMSGLTVLKRLTSVETSPPVLIVTGHYCEEEVEQDAWRLGAAAVAYKPFLDEHALAAALRVIIDGCGSSPLLRVRRNDVPPALHGRSGDARFDDLSLPGIIAVSAAMRGVVEWIAHVGPTEGTILLTGETGVGKEVIAQAIHRASRRGDHPFVTVNCGTIPETLLECELFGHRKGAFTGANSDKAGLVETAHRGTLFLDEIGDLPLAVQGHLLRFLEAGEVRRIGDTKTTRVDVRVIAATNRPIREEVARRRFREDLYFRLAVLHRHIPPLRERRDDVEPLVAWWLPRLARRDHRRPKPIAPEALAALRAHDWPGNVRELRNVLEQAVCLAPDGPLTARDVTTILSAPSAAGPSTSNAPDIGRTLSALEEHGGNQTHAARALGINRTTLWRRLRRYGLGGQERD